MELECQGGLALEFHTYGTGVPRGVGTGVSCLWHWSFMPMALEFLPYETKLSSHRLPKATLVHLLLLGAFCCSVTKHFHTFARRLKLDRM